MAGVALRARCSCTRWRRRAGRRRSGRRFARPRLRLMRRMQRQVGALGAGRVVATSCVRAARGGSALAAGLRAGKSAGCAAAQAAARHARRAAQHAPTSFRQQGRWLGVQTLVCGAGGAHCTAKVVGAVWDGGRTAGERLGGSQLQPRALPRAQRCARVIAPPNEEATWGALGPPGGRAGVFGLAGAAQTGPTSFAAAGALWTVQVHIGAARSAGQGAKEVGACLVGALGCGASGCVVWSGR